MGAVEAARRSPERAILIVVVPLFLIFSPNIILTNSRLLDIGITYTIFSIALYGVGLLYGQVGLLSIAHSAFLGLGAYTAAILLIQTDLGFWISMPMTRCPASLSCLAVAAPMPDAAPVIAIVFTVSPGKVGSSEYYGTA